MKKENEIWKVIPNYENYEASNFGRIRSIDRVVKRDRYTTRKIKGKILQQFAKNSGYLQVNLSKNSKIETKTVHRLVAITFLENTNNYTDINHKDENKHNNNVSNLEWCNYEYNNTYKDIHLRRNKDNTTRKVIQYDLDMNEIKRWNTITDASKEFNTNIANIIKCCKGERNHCCGFKWRYYE